MEKLTLCRICLMKNVRMHVVSDNRLQEIFEKLTNIPFITEDSRPMLACFFCYARLKQCYKFRQKCVEADAVFTQMRDQEYEQKQMQAELEFYGGFLKSSIDHFNIEDLGLQEDKREDKVDIKEELTGGCERMEYVEIKVECHSDVSEQETKDVSYPGFDDNPNTHSNSEDDIPLTRMKTGVEQVKKKRRATKKERVEKSTPATTKQKRYIKEILEDTVSTKCKKNEQANSKVIDRTKGSKFKSVTKIIEPIKRNPITKTVIKKSIINSEDAANCTNLCNNINNDDLKCNYRGIDSDVIKKYDLNHSNLSKEKPHKCDVCHRSFIKKDNFKKHIRIHTGEKPYKCEICHSSFNQTGHLKRHIRVHTGVKPYKCDICHSSFTQRGSLKLHIRIHTGGKPYKCGICQSSFSQKGGLNSHIRIHTGEKPYKCDVCQRSFTRNIYLKRHSYTHAQKTI